MRFLLLVLFSCWGSTATLRAQVVASSDSAQLRCELRTLKTEFYFREPIAFDVRLINKSKAPVLVVDGDLNSDIWACFPEPRITVYQLRGKRPKKALETITRTSCLKTWANAENFALVGPGQYITLESVREVGIPLLFYAFKFYENLAPGRYEVVCTYSTVSNENVRNTVIGYQPKQQQAELRKLVSRVPTMTINSEPLYLTITRH